MPGEARQAVRQQYFEVPIRRGWGYNLSAQPVLPAPSRPVVSTETPVSLCPPESHDNRNNSRLGGGYLLPWQSACHKSTELAGGPRCACMSETVYCISSKKQVKHRKALMWCGCVRRLCVSRCYNRVPEYRKTTWLLVTATCSKVLNVNTKMIIGN